MSSLRHYTSDERKAMPVHTGFMLYFPDAIAAVSRVSKKGNDKHNPGEPLGWQRGKSADQTDCAGRHLLTPHGVDPDSKELELAHAAWRLMAQLQLAEEKRLVGAGIMPLSGVVPVKLEPPICTCFSPERGKTCAMHNPPGCVCGRGRAHPRTTTPELSPDARYEA